MSEVTAGIAVWLQLQSHLLLAFGLKPNHSKTTIIHTHAQKQKNKQTNKAKENKTKEQKKQTSNRKREGGGGGGR